MGLGVPPPLPPPLAPQHVDLSLSCCGSYRPGARNCHQGPLDLHGLQRRMDPGPCPRKGMESGSAGCNHRCGHRLHHLGVHWLERGGRPPLSRRFLAVGCPGVGVPHRATRCAGGTGAAPSGEAGCSGHSVDLPRSLLGQRPLLKKGNSVAEARRRSEDADRRGSRIPGGHRGHQCRQSTLALALGRRGAPAVPIRGHSGRRPATPWKPFRSHQSLGVEETGHWRSVGPSDRTRTKGPLAGSHSLGPGHGA
mmetsp:Transcript_3327/g.9661  ORF Transcript_3327/g.9661 Transcript_3327/m.9661 type:complete len:251 (-) Transcript_3327:689-1441(-)